MDYVEFPLPDIGDDLLSHHASFYNLPGDMKSNEESTSAGAHQIDAIYSDSEPEKQRRRKRKRVKRFANVKNTVIQEMPDEYSPPATIGIQGDLKYGSECGLLFIDTVSEKQQKDRIIKNKYGHKFLGYINENRAKRAEISTASIKEGFVRSSFIEINDEDSPSAISQLDLNQVQQIKFQKNMFSFRMTTKVPSNSPLLKYFDEKNTSMIVVFDLFISNKYGGFTHADRFVSNAFVIISKACVARG